VESIEETGGGIVMDDPEIRKKHILFHPICGGCGKNIRRNPNEQIGFLCKACKPRIHMEEADSACEACQFELDCVDRISVGAWVRCETPDVSDVQRLLDMEELDDPTTRSALEDALACRGNRPLLEAAVSKSVAALRKRGITWKQGALSY
jgi:hypothetical protein